jgi:hypothetical protein
MKGTRDQMGTGRNPKQILRYQPERKRALSCMQRKSGNSVKNYFPSNASVHTVKLAETVN